MSYTSVPTRQYSRQVEAGAGSGKSYYLLLASIASMGSSRWFRREGKNAGEGMM